ncbi:MAG: hypothetical protein IJ887_16845 [Prevotella sp.]|nr:hypothetical protein [Prevotella sp.]MBR6188134.1 hypothetical protein [Prevotella sp.]
MKNKKDYMKTLRWVSPILALLALVTMGWGLVTQESEYLWKAQELNLFLDTPLFLRQQMVTSGWLLTWLGTWFTEFFFHPWLGVTLLCGLWAVLMVVAGRTLRVSLAWTAVLLVPVALLLIMDVDLGYWIYYLKLRGHFFAATIGVIIALGGLWLYRVLPSRWYLRPLFVVVGTAVFYPLIGFYGLLFALLCAVLTWRLKDMSTSARAMTTVVAALAIGVVPLVYYRYVFCQTNILNIYWTGLPLFIYGEETTAYYIPYYLLVAVLVLMVVLYGMKAPKLLNRPLGWFAGHVLLLAVLTWGVCHFWYTDYNFHKELRMQRCMEECDWEGMLREARDQKVEPTRAIVMMRNLALFRLGRQGDEMYHYPAGAADSDTPLPLNMTQVVGRSIYYNYGMLNFCYRWCLEDGVELGWRIEYLKYLVRCALINGEQRVVQKYLNLLRHTRYYGEWADHMAALSSTKGGLGEVKEFVPILHMLNYDDYLASDNALVENFLMNKFANSTSEDTLYQEQSLLAALWTKDIQTFWPHFFNYARLHPQDHMPRHYQEAAYLYGHLENEVDISHMPFDEQVKRDYEEFMATAQQYRGMKEEQLRHIMYPRFGKTFYFEYFLIRNQKMY